MREKAAAVSTATAVGTAVVVAVGTAVAVAAAGTVVVGTAVAAVVRMADETLGGPS